MIGIVHLISGYVRTYICPYIYHVGGQRMFTAGCEPSRRMATEWAMLLR